MGQKAGRESLRARRMDHKALAAMGGQPGNGRRQPSSAGTTRATRKTPLVDPALSASQSPSSSSVFEAVSSTAERDGKSPAAALAERGAPAPAPSPSPSPAAPASAQSERALPALAQRASQTALTAWRWVRGLSGESWLWIGILALAAVLRFWGLGDKPLHHDESMHAFFSLSFARDPASYEYDPLLHGPFQFHAEGIIFGIILGISSLFQVASAAGNAWINDTTARLLPAAMGLALVAITYGLRRELGRVAAPVAAFLLAVSPAFVYFSRFLREDIYFACFTYLMVMCAVQFAHRRDTRWLVATAVAFVLAYATFEGIFLTGAVFVGFLAVLAVWELGYAISDRLPAALSGRERGFFGHAAPLLLLGAAASGLAAWALRLMHQLSTAITAHPQQSDLQVAQLENTTVGVLLYASIALAAVVMIVLLRQIFFDLEPRSAHSATAAAELAAGGALDDADMPDEDADELPRRSLGWLTRLPSGLDPERQPFLRLLLGTSWIQWFVALVVGWVVFAALFWVVPGPDHGVLTIAQGFQVGVGRGIWQGLYYWLQQQQVARGGQPWYYYLVLIPLYEQLAVVFGAVGIVRSLLRPTTFRLFLVWWFAGSLALYSWAGEKMPWLSIHLLLPLMLLAALGLEPPLRAVWAFVQRLAAGERTFTGRALMRPAAAALAVLGGLMLLVPMVSGMLTLTHQDAADGPHEMMVYVQTTPDVQRVMDKINHADAVLYGGRHQLKIAVGQGEEWPFYWYLRDYWLDPHPAVYAVFDPALNDPSLTQKDVLLLTAPDAQTFLQAHPTGYRAHTYQLRSWWDEGYKPLNAGGVGLGPWLSYGDTPPPNAHFDAGRAATRLWDWLWWRKPLGSATGPYYEFVLIVRDGVPIQP